MLLDIIIVALGFVGLIWGADKFVFGASSLAQNLNVSPLVIGLTIVALGTSAPEIFSSAASALAGEPELALGNAIGSNIFNVGIALGVACMIKPLRPPASVARRELPAMLFVTVVTGLLLANFILGVMDSLVLIAIVALFAYYLMRTDRDALVPDDDDMDLLDRPSNIRAAAWLIFGLLLLMLSAEALVRAAMSIAESMDVSPAIIGLTLIALGTSLPELAATVACAMRGHHDLAIGNIVGSNIMNLLIVLPFPGLLAPGPIDSALVLRDYSAMLLMTTLLSVICFVAIKRGKSIGRLSGAAFLCIYAGWFGIMYWQQ